MNNFTKENQVSGGEYEVRDWPGIRNVLELFLRAHKPFTVYGHAECDVTAVLDRLKALRKQFRISLSLNTYLVYVVSRVAARHEDLRSYKQGQKKIVFRHADVSLAILKKLPDGVRVPVPYIVREADTKSLAVINGELKEAIKSDLTGDPKVRMRRKLAKFPLFVQRLVYRHLFSTPQRAKKFFGNVGITNLQHLGYDSPMTGLPPNIFSGQFSVGNVSDQYRPDAQKKPVLRKILSMGAGFDHLVMDGMAMAAVARDFSRMVERAEGIDDAFVHETLKGGDHGDA